MKTDNNLKKQEVTASSHKTSYKNFPMVPRVVFGSGCFSQLGDILLPQRKSSEAPFIFLVDDFFENEEFMAKVPLMFHDEIIFISADEEPKQHKLMLWWPKSGKNTRSYPLALLE